MDSGVQQPASFQVRILFADAGCISSRLKRSLIRDERPELETNELVDTAEIFEAEIIIGSDFPVNEPPKESHMSHRICNSTGEHATSYHCWYDPEAWSVTDFRTVPMNHEHPRLRIRDCAIMHLLHDRGYEIAVMFVKVLKGNYAAAHTLQFGIGERQAVVDMAFKFLQIPRDCPVIVAGDLGVGLSTLHTYIQSNALQEKVQTHCIRRQSFHTIFFSAKPGYRCTSVDTDSPRMVAYQIASNSGDPHPTAKVALTLALTPSQASMLHVTLTPRSEVHMKILQRLTDSEKSTFPNSEDARRTVELLYQPVAEQTRDEQGVVHTNPIDVDVSRNTFVCTIVLLRKLRADAGVGVDDKTLSNFEFELALQKLKDIFEHNFLLNKKLACGLRLKREDSSALTRLEKKRINTDFRGAFSSWLRSLIGDRVFAFALLRHGIFDFSDLQRCAKALRQGASNDDDDGGVSQSARHTPNPELRRAAVSARRLEKEAKKYAMWVSQGRSCSDWQKKQIILLQTGALTKQVRDANAAYGFGKGAERALSREEAMTLEVFTSQVLNEYMKQDDDIAATLTACCFTLKVFSIDHSAFTVAIPSYCPKDCIVTRSESRWVSRQESKHIGRWVTAGTSSGRRK